jgi:hypothetical protein
LIEIAIVLVIIGLLLGGVLKGQELINSAKVKNLAGDFKNIPVFIYGYQDKYKALPGDDSAAVTHLPVTPGITVTNGDGSGVIDGAWNATSGESYNFWQHVRLAGFAPGSIDTANAAGDYVPKNAVGGNIGVTNAVGNIPITGMRGTYIVCSNAIPGKFAKQLDITLDDGNPATGSLMISTVTAGGAPIATTALVLDDTTYLVCMGY